MKVRHSLLLTLVVATAVLVTFNHFCWAEQPAQQATADINKPILPAPRLEPSEALIEVMMKRIANTDPQRAEELGKLRETNPEEFKKEIGKAMREMGHRPVGGWDRQKGRREPGQHMEMPFETRGQEGRRWPAIMRQRHEEFLEWLQNNYPDQAKELIELREQDPQLYMRKLGLSFETYGRIAETAKENPELAEVLKEDLELKKQRDSLLSRIKDTTDDKKKQQLIKELEEVVSARFDLVVKRTQIRYEQLSQKLERLKEELKQKEAKVEKWKDPEFKKQNVKARMEKLLSETEKFSWE
jgi:hypothetical protein